MGVAGLQQRGGGELGGPLAVEQARLAEVPALRHGIERQQQTGVLRGGQGHPAPEGPQQLAAHAEAGRMQRQTPVVLTPPAGHPADRDRPLRRFPPRGNAAAIGQQVEGGRGEPAHLRMAPEHGHLPGQLTRRELIIGIEHLHQGAAGPGQGQGAGQGWPKGHRVGLLANPGVVREGLLEGLRTIALNQPLPVPGVVRLRFLLPQAVPGVGEPGGMGRQHRRDHGNEGHYAGGSPSM